MNPHAVNCAVVAGQGNIATQIFDLSFGVFHGTAFCVAPSLFLTAAHVFRDAQGDGKEVAVARLTPGQFQGIVVQDFELFENIDLALLHCPGLVAEILPFNFAPLGFLVDVFSMGFAFGLEPPKFHLRAFKGHVVNRRELDTLSGRPPGYELSFVPPPGLSGGESGGT